VSVTSSRYVGHLPLEKAAVRKPIWKLRQQRHKARDVILDGATDREPAS
jgi:hypothetical protein